ncbi:hypothetical protein [Epilithonimonas sp. UC225_85]|uniref:hypothetical protein n=1 Tax=Epilithonimonas sp. UC225_85 TaxID=3350167 RepID=UPI0036D262F4
MKKLILLLIVLPTISFSQKLDLGVDFGYGFSNIVNSKVTEGRAVIGSAMWKPNYGLSAVYYFKNPNIAISSAVKIEYKRTEKGSVSEDFSTNKYQFDVNSINLQYRIAGGIGNGLRFYGDLGLGFNTFDNNSTYYFGDKEPKLAFNNLNENLDLKKSETNFIFGVGLEKSIYKNEIFASIGAIGEAGINKIAPSSYRTQGLGFTCGIKYEFDLKND